MKKFLIVLFALVCAVCIYGCQAEQPTNSKKEPSNTSLSVAESSTSVEQEKSSSSISQQSSFVTSAFSNDFSTISSNSSSKNSQDISCITSPISTSSSVTSSTSSSSVISSTSSTSSSSQTVYYSVVCETAENGSVTPSKTKAYVGEEINLTIVANEGYKLGSVLVNGQSITKNTFTMPEQNVTILVTFVKESYIITKLSVTGGAITISKTTATFGETISLTNTASAGYAFSSYKIDGESQTANTFTMPAKNIEVGATFVKKIQNLGKYTFNASANSNSNKTGNVTFGEGVCTSEQNYFPFVYGSSIAEDNFYFEVEVSLTNIYNNEALSKCGIAFSVRGESYFFCIDAFESGFGTNKWMLFANGRGNVKTGVNWNWQDLSTRKNSFSSDYTNGKYVKLAVMRVGGFYKFFCDDKLMFDMWLPNATGTATIGVHSFNVGFKVKNAKYGTSASAISNATAYYDQTKNPTKITVDGNIADWEQNAKTSYGYDNGNNYFYGACFEGSDYVYVAMVARTNSYITTYSGTNWYLNTNFEMRAGTTDDKQLYVSITGNGVQKSGDLTDETNKIQSAVVEKINDVDGYYIIYMECAIPYSMWGGTKGSDTYTRIGFAFRSGESASRMCEEASGNWWCGTAHINKQNLVVGASGITVAPRIYTSNITQLTTISKPTTEIRNVQGGWTDGTYFYQMFIKTNNNVDNQSILVKWNLSTKKEVARSSILATDHANDLTYDSKNNRFVVVHNTGTPNKISFIDSSTLQITGSKIVSRKLSGLDYNATRNQYVACISGTYSFIIYDENFNEVGSVINTAHWVSGFTKQGMACNDNYIAYIYYNRDIIAVYDWSGNFKAFIEVNFPQQEGENITFISKTAYTSGFYVSCNDKSGGDILGANVFKVVPAYRCGG